MEVIALPELSLTPLLRHLIATFGPAILTQMMSASDRRQRYVQHDMLLLKDTAGCFEERS